MMKLIRYCVFLWCFLLVGCATTQLSQPLPKNEAIGVSSQMNAYPNISFIGTTVFTNKPEGSDKAFGMNVQGYDPFVKPWPKLIKKISLDQLTLMMMDEYVYKKNNKYYLVNPTNHYSCVKFSKNVIKKLLNYKKNNLNSLKDKNIYFPSINNPKNYDILIGKLGGIDLFLLASGSSDGHVAFNNVYSKMNQKTHIIKLSLQTRKDNMKTFLHFNNINEVPKYGITVGLKTISTLSKSAVLVLTGKEKRTAYLKIANTKEYIRTWPASIIHSCKKSKIYIDKRVKLYK